MPQMHELYALLLAFSATASAITAIIIWRRRTARGAVALLLLMLALIVWSTTYAIHWLQADPQARRFWLDATYLGVVSVPSLFFIFLLTFTQRDSWLNRQTYLLLALEPILTFLLLITDPYHGLFFAGKRAAGASDILSGGPWFWVNVVYSYGLILLAFLILLRFYLRTRRPFRRQAGLLLMGALLPWIGNITSLLGLKPPGLDLTPIVFTVTGIIFTTALLRTRLLDLVPVARSVLIEGMQDGLVVLDMQNRIVDINPSALALLDAQADAIIGQDIRTAIRHWPDIIERFQGVYEAREEVLLDGDPPRHFDVQISPLYGRGRHLTGRLITWHDISERKKADLERERLIGEMNAYAHTVAHDLKNPLNVTLGWIDLLKEIGAERLDEELNGYIRSVQQGGQLMLRIVDDLLLLATVRSQKEVPARRLSMAACIDKALDRLELLVEQSNATVVLPETWPPALGYQPWVEEIWANYISNAIKYGGTPPHIELGADVVPVGQARFWVKDNGRGLTSAEQERLFEQFERLDSTHTEGHGLGLSVVRRIADRLGGHVGVESAVGEGSKFYFTLPAPPGVWPDSRALDQ